MSYCCKASIYITREPSYSKWIFTGCVPSTLNITRWWISWNLYDSIKLYHCKASIYITRAPSHIKWIFNRLCPIHFKYNKMMDFTKLVCLYWTLRLQSLYIHYRSTIIFLVDFHGLCPIYFQCNKVMDFTKPVFLYATLPLQSLYIRYQSTVIFKVDFHRLRPIHTE